MTKLSEALQDFYERKGGRIVFQNGMSLNQLALEMWEKLGYQEVDSSVLSRVINGERIFGPKQLEAFCTILNLPKEKQNLLKQKLFQDLMERFGLEESFFGTKDKAFIDLIEENVEKIHLFAEKDSPILVEDWSEKILEKIEKVIPFVINDKQLNQLFNLSAKLLIIQGHCVLVANSEKTGYWLIKNKMEKLRKIGVKLKNKNFIGASDVYIGNSLYNQKSYQKSLKFLSSASNLLTLDFDNEIGGIPLRQAALSYAYLKNVREFETIKENALKRLPQYSSDLQCEILEGLARGEASLGKNKETEKMISLAKSAWLNIKKEKERYLLLRKIQLIRTEIESELQLGTKTNRNYLEKMGKEGLKISQKYGYKRHGEKILNLLNLSLN